MLNNTQLPLFQSAIQSYSISIAIFAEENFFSIILQKILNKVVVVLLYGDRINGGLKAEDKIKNEILLQL